MQIQFMRVEDTMKDKRITEPVLRCVRGGWKSQNVTAWHADEDIDEKHLDILRVSSNAPRDGLRRLHFLAIHNDVP